ncbi:X-Pro dipeptidyl-peptidase [Blastomyces dermatitidis ER-3]|uniref:X-Pro dipeptidyl-peptidase n=1 Tax=Ajellomyces dermatitidis (strain ER-3 / ATCC MYA-2586) TaxID=559297 RepID=A0ABP2EMN7_AJEDR|nr:X-Pro dipeptidyl-peptidase [Blastomyces dermatitidis ER-3]EEQ84642.2 X-Pro dipeptidyl-peptidase [Blastomyces dermatitidis ER-3]
MQQRIERVAEDLNCLKKFYNIPFSPERVSRLQAYYNEQLSDLSKEGFDSHSQDGNIDYLLLQNYLKRNMKQLDTLMQTGKVTIDKPSASRAAKAADQLRNHLQEWFGFFNAYDPLFTWWVNHMKLMGTTPGDEEDAIVGKPIGRDGLLVDLGRQLAPGSRVCEDPPGRAGPTDHLCDLTLEAIDYVTKQHGLVTVPPLAAGTWRILMTAQECADQLVKRVGDELATAEAQGLLSDIVFCEEPLLYKMKHPYGSESSYRNIRASNQELRPRYGLMTVMREVACGASIPVGAIQHVEPLRPR